MKRRGFPELALCATLLALVGIASQILMAGDVGGSQSLAGALIVALLIFVIGLVAVLVSLGSRRTRPEEPPSSDEGAASQ